MRIEQLEYITAVTRHGSLRRASEHLHISQPALSEAVSKLERELGVTLLDRHRSGTRISQRGRTLLSDITDVLEAVDRLRANAGRPRRSATTLTLGTAGALSPAILGPAVWDLGSSLPGARIEVSTLAEVEALPRVTDGTVDVALVQRLPTDELFAELTGQRVTSGRPVAALHPKDPLAASDLLTREQLRQGRWIGSRAGSITHRLALQVMGPKLPPDVATADTADLAMAMVAAGLGAVLLPDYSVIGEPLVSGGQIVIRPIAASSHDATLTELTVVGRREVVRSTAVRALINALRERSESARIPSVVAAERGRSTG